MKLIKLFAILLLFASCKTRQVVKTTKDSVKVIHSVEHGIDTSSKTNDIHLVSNVHILHIDSDATTTILTPHPGTKTTVEPDGAISGTFDKLTTTRHSNTKSDNTTNFKFEGHSELKKGVDTGETTIDSTAVKTTSHKVDAHANNSYTYTIWISLVVICVAVGWYIKVVKKW